MPQLQSKMISTPLGKSRVYFTILTRQSDFKAAEKLKMKIQGQKVAHGNNRIVAGNRHYRINCESNKIAHEKHPSIK